MQRFLLAKRAWLVLLALTLVAFFYGLGGVPLLGPDEPRYAQVAREMFERGDWVTPTLNGRTWFEKPALLYWLMMAGYRLFGVTEFAARAGAALAGVLTVLLVGWLGRRVEFESGEGLRAFGFTAAAVTASTAGLIVFSHAGNFDIVLTATVTAALACFFASDLERDEARRRALLVGFYAAVGASLLAKGLVGAVFPAGVIALYFLLRGRMPNPLRLGVPWGALLALLVAALWYAPVISRHGHAFVDEFFLQHHLARYVSNKYHHPQPFYFYVPIMAMLALPWTAFLVSGLAGLRETNWRAEDAAGRMRVMALAWLVVPVVFFSFSGSKLPGYVLPALPAAALLAADRALKYLRGNGELLTMRVTGLLALALFAAGLAYAFDPTGRLSSTVSLSPAVAVVLPAGVCGVLALFAARRRGLCFAAVAAGTFLTILLIGGLALETFARRETVAHLLRRSEAEGYGGLPVFQIAPIERTSEFYAAGRLVYDAGGQPLSFGEGWELVEAVRQAGGRSLVLVPLESLNEVTGEQGIEVRNLGDNGSYALLHVRVLP